MLFVLVFESIIQAIPFAGLGIINVDTTLLTFEALVFAASIDYLTAPTLP